MRKELFGALGYGCLLQGYSYMRYDDVVFILKMLVSRQSSKLPKYASIIRVKVCWVYVVFVSTVVTGGYKHLPT